MRQVLLSVPFAHRGLHDEAAGIAQNSLSAVAAAVRAGMGVEIDVRVAADGVAVHHDAVLHGRDGPRVSGLTLAALARHRLAVGADTVPSLASVLRLVGGRQPVLVDLKTSMQPRLRDRLVRAVAEQLRPYPGPVAVVTFDPWALRLLRTLCPQIPRGQSAGVSHAGLPASWLVGSLCRPVDAYWSNRISHPHFVTFNIDRLPSTTLASLRRRGLLVLGWTVRSPRQLQTAAPLVDNVIVEGDAVRALSRQSGTPSLSVPAPSISSSSGTA